MKTIQSTALLIAGLLTSAGSWAAATPAGTDIENTATATYYAAGDSTNALTAQSTFTFKVQELIDVTISSDATESTVTSGETGVVVSYVITNTGNGSEDFTITDVNGTGDDFDLEGISLYYEDNNAGFDGTESTVAADGVINLDAGESVTILAVVNVPATAGDGQSAETTLTAVSNTSGASAAAEGDVLDGVGDDGVDAVIASAGANYQADHTYTVENTTLVRVAKNIIGYEDQFGGDSRIPGATVTYQILVSVYDDVTDLVITDPLPEDVTYEEGTLYYEAADNSGNDISSSGTLLSDDSDTDIGKFEQSADENGRVTVDLGDVDYDSTTLFYTIQFQATIN
ncbi:MAG: hypothetical protein CMI02_01700 [Oceanospirillaceae bacterium]|nr:hypothetical protein [Oceanospirillaceae bacterium]MBT10734.1 hypothetical protein [Oceanospirillaceae bacterium]|tara:strand:+ start:55066 stop:56094 length:1029 start_codon:yes stop_codon:yes gene_type:complete